MTASIGFFALTCLMTASNFLPLQDILRDTAWDYRVFVVVAPSPDEQAVRDPAVQMKTASPELAARDAFVLWAFQDNAEEFTLSSAEYEQAATQLVGAWPRRLAPAPDPRATTLILIGKDGTEKARQTAPRFDLDSLLGLIDTMPMRRQEMRER